MNKVDITKEQWDFLIVLDACRYDYFERTYKNYLNGQLTKRISAGSSTDQWRDKSFPDYYDDIVYISANPHFTETIPVSGYTAGDHFHKVHEIWKTGWDKEKGTVLPETMTATAIEIIKNSPEKKFIIHYLQPHAPYIVLVERFKGYIDPDCNTNRIIAGAADSENKHIFRKKILKNLLKYFKNNNILTNRPAWVLRKLLALPPEAPMEIAWRYVGKKALRQAYEINLKLVLVQIAELIKHLSGRIVITADHGELLGENFLYSHPTGSTNRILIEVPWLIIEKERKRSTVKTLLPQKTDTDLTTKTKLNMSSHENKKVLIIGLDSGTWDILTPAMDQGFMPNLKNLVDTGASGILKSTMPAITPAAWSCFQTGVNPGQNGVFNFSYWDKHLKTQKFVNSNSLATTIWDTASNIGKRVGLVNVPMTYPPYKINGCMVTGILTPSIKSDFTYPTILKKQLLNAVSGYHIFNLGNASAGQPHKNFEGFVQQMADIVECRFQAAEFILNKEDPFDIFMVHFQASDIIQHAMWGYMDKNHAMYDSCKHEYILENFYRRVDEKIGSIRHIFEKKTGSDFLTLVVSDHGSEAHNKRFNLGNWLLQEGLLKLNPLPHKPSLLKKITRKFGVGAFLKRFIASGTVAKMEKIAKRPYQRFVWNQSKAFSFGRSGEGYIYLLEENQAQREKTASTLIEKLKNICDPETDTAIAKNVFRREQIYHGKALGNIPDIIIEPAPGYSFTGFCKPDQPLFQKVCPGSDFHIAKHHMDGIIVAAGPGIQHDNSISAGLVDIVPTLSYYMDLPIDQNTDGKIVQQLFTEEFLSKNPLPKKTNIDQMAKTGREKIYSQEDQDQIRRRLEELGYM
jgi:predicted AlkP superfamily phosphohydrolase/phosphomutase